MKRVYSSHDRAAVHHCRNLLEAEGVPAVVKNEFLSSAMGELPPAECQAEVWVLHEADAPRAEEFLKNVFSVKSGNPWRCTCGEILEPQFTHCWHCGAGRP